MGRSTGRIHISDFRYPRTNSLAISSRSIHLGQTLYRGQAEDKNDKGTERFELYESKQRRERDFDDGANVGDEVEHKN